MEGDNFFFKWIPFIQKVGAKKKNPENCGSGKSGFQWFWKIFSSKFASTAIDMPNVSSISHENV